MVNEERNLLANIDFMAITKDSINFTLVS